MLTDTTLRNEGMRVLAENLGWVEAERFIALMLREPFDYTEWQRAIQGRSLERFFEQCNGIS